MYTDSFSVTTYTFTINTATQNLSDGRISTKIVLDINYSFLGKEPREKIVFIVFRSEPSIFGYGTLAAAVWLSRNNNRYRSNPWQSLANVHVHLCVTTAEPSSCASVPAYCILPVPASTHYLVLQLTIQSLLVAGQRPRTRRREAPTVQRARTPAQARPRWLYHISD
jgi:hypothetical protein